MDSRFDTKASYVKSPLYLSGEADTPFIHSTRSQGTRMVTQSTTPLRGVPWMCPTHWLDLQRTLVRVGLASRRGWPIG